MLTYCPTLFEIPDQNVKLYNCKITNIKTKHVPIVENVPDKVDITPRKKTFS